MIVYLEAFGGKLSGEMEWPDNSPPQILLSLDIARPNLQHAQQSRVIGKFERSSMVRVDLVRKLIMPVYVLVDYR